MSLAQVHYFQVSGAEEENLVQGNTGMVLDLPKDVGLDPDDPASVFHLLREGERQGVDGALLTIVNIDGGAPRALGAQMAVLEDGRYCGYVSGGCVEAAVAGEAMRAIAAGRDEILRFGTGSRFIDIQLPCGGGIDVHIHVRPSPVLIRTALDAMAERSAFALRLDTSKGSAKLVNNSAARARSEWHDPIFVRHYHPPTKLMLIGEGHELVMLARLSRALGLPVSAYMTADAGAASTAAIGAEVTLLLGADLPLLSVDPFTAIIFLLHDRFKETRLLESALNYDPFYVGALGSRRTHAARVSRMIAAGISDSRIAALHGPIGLFGPTRAASTLAISVLGEITDARLRLDG